MFDWRVGEGSAVREVEDAEADEPDQVREAEVGGGLERSGTIARERQSIRFRLALRACRPCGPSARVESLNKSKKNTHSINEYYRSFVLPWRSR